MDWLGASIINRFSNASYNWYRGAPYHIPTQYDSGGGVGTRYATWLDVNNAFVAQPGPTDFPNPDDIGDGYDYVARAALGGVVNLTNGQATWDWLNSHLHSNGILNTNPKWAILPRGYTPPADTTPPAAVTNLATSSPTSNSITLTWTAPGDDGSTGTATSYDIRYSTATITDTNWASATQVSGEPTPLVAGTNQSMVVSGLSAATTYYFALKTSDEVPNVSALSNVPSGTTTAAGDTTPPAAVTNLATSSPTSGSITLTWTAPGDDGNTGTATTYDIRYSTSTINDSNWASATQVSGEPTPLVAGTNQSMVISGLSASTTYYFAMKTADEVPNWSTLSNVASGTTSAAGGTTVQFSTTSGSGSESVTPANVTVTLNQSSSQTVTVSYAVTGGTATQGSDYTLPAGGNQIIALKRDAGLVQGGAIDSRFTSLGAGNVVVTTVKDAQVWGAGDATYQNFGVRTQVPSGSGGAQGVLAWSLAAYAGGTVNKAQIRFKCTMGNNNMQIAAIKSHDWAEGNKDSNYPGVAPAAPGVTWANPSATNTSNSGPLGWGTSSNAMLDTTGGGADLYAYSDFVSQPGGDAYVVADVTSIVQDWLSGAKPNYGVLIQVGNHNPYLSEAGTDLEPVLFLDVTLPGGLVQFQPGQTSQTIPITIIDDTLHEPNETIIITLSNPTNATLGANTTYTYTIIDNDPAPTVQFTNATGSGAESVTSVNIPVSLNTASGQTVTVNYAVTGGTATGGGVDYTLASGQLTFSPGVTSQNISMTVVNDTLHEANETVIVTLSSPTNATLGTNTTYTYTINDDDAAPTVQFTSATGSGSESVTTVNIPVTLSAASGMTTTVNYAVTGGTATGGGVDYTLASGQLTFNPGVTSQNIAMTVVDDSIPESNETVIITLSSPTNATLGTNTTYTYTIIDNDTPAMPTFVAAGAVASGTGAITPALPSGLQTNDILLLFLETANQAISISNQNGGTWTQVTGSPQGTGTAGGSSATCLTAFWSRYNGSQGAPTTSDSGNHQLGRMIAIRGATTSGNPWDVEAGGVDATSNTSGSIPGTTTTVANTLVVVAIATSLPDASGTANFSGWTNANLSSITERTDNTVTAGNGGGLGLATGGKATAGAYGATAVTLANAAVKGMMSIALKP